MAKLKWDNIGERFYETGVKNVALYVFDNTSEVKAYKEGVAWNGVTAISESPSGAEPTALYADDKKYLNLLSAEEFSASIEAYTYPDEFAECDGSASLLTGVTVGQQPRSKFALAYKTTIGNDEAGNSLGYKLHIIYNCLAAPSEKAYNTINDSPEAITFSWEISTTPVTFTVGGKEYSTACVTIDSRTADPTKLATLEEKLFGGTDDLKKPTLVLPDEIYDTLKEGA